ncbi:hypothetical protein EV702DRAFT_1041172 [Suillus placidus]|uniref:DNA-directed RNA polymerase n=1 Tax=Suillus placidus TaxID=48579 RepID=A0A9P7A5W8_9AGAM|nr:hypothetical protein EV702DRAFT_1041172 [Suillus placidus]
MDGGFGISNETCVVFCEKGPGATRDLFTGIQMVVNFWLFHNGFSIGIGHGLHSTKRISEKKQLVAEIIEEAYHDWLKALPGMTIRESFESKVEHELNCAHDDSGQYAQKNLKDDDNVKQMVTAGSKGSYINISQIPCLSMRVQNGGGEDGGCSSS